MKFKNQIFNIIITVLLVILIILSIIYFLFAQQRNPIANDDNLIVDSYNSVNSFSALSSVLSSLGDKNGILGAKDENLNSLSIKENLKDNVIENASLSSQGLLSLSKDNLSNKDKKEIEEDFLQYKLKDNYCIDNCDLYFVNKDNFLDKNYSPKIISANGVGLKKNAMDSWNEFFKSAKSDGINFKAISSYRSYNEQINTFNYWVSKEMEKGVSKELAQKNANVYSAKAGASEHQLGTTLDVICETCISFEKSEGNLKVWDYIEKNSYKFGFVISYPDGKDSLTGYTYEPWHIRYIGKDLARELNELNYLEENSNNYLWKFLKERQ